MDRSSIIVSVLHSFHLEISKSNTKKLDDYDTCMTLLIPLGFRITLKDIPFKTSKISITQTHDDPEPRSKSIAPRTLNNHICLWVISSGWWTKPLLGKWLEISKHPCKNRLFNSRYTPPSLTWFPWKWMLSNRNLQTSRDLNFQVNHVKLWGVY